MNNSKLVREKYHKIDDKWINYAEWILEYDQYRYPDDLDDLSIRITDCLQTKFCPKKYRFENKTNPMFGYCYVVTQSLYYFFMDANLTIMSADCEYADKHWWLQDGEKIIDLTADQYYRKNRKPPYENGKKSMWYGWKNRPHKITLEFMHKVQKNSNLFFKKVVDKPNTLYYI